MWVPPRVSQELQNETAQRQAVAQGAMSHQLAWMKEFTSELRRIDEHLQLVWCPDPAPIEAVACGCHAGRFNIVRHNPGAPMSGMPITGPRGEFREPDSSVFEELKRADLWSSANQHERKERARKIEAAREKREEDERQARAEHALELWKAASRTQVSMNASTRWAQSHAGLMRGKARDN